MNLPSLTSDNYFFVATRHATNRTGLSRKEVVDNAMHREASVWRLEDMLQQRYAVSHGGYTFIVLKTFRMAPDGEKRMAFIVDGMRDNVFDATNHREKTYLKSREEA